MSIHPIITEWYEVVKEFDEITGKRVLALIERCFTFADKKCGVIESATQISDFASKTKKVLRELAEIVVDGDKVQWYQNHPNSFTCTPEMSDFLVKSIRVKDDFGVLRKQLLFLEDTIFDGYFKRSVKFCKSDASDVADMRELLDISSEVRRVFETGTKKVFNVFLLRQMSVF